MHRPGPESRTTVLIPAGVWYKTAMAHTRRDKKKLLDRVRRIRGQVNALYAALDQEQECSDVLHRLAACRGALNSLMVEVLEGHVKFHVLDPDRKPSSERAEAAQELIDVIQTYLK